MKNKDALSFFTDVPAWARQNSKEIKAFLLIVLFVSILFGLNFEYLNTGQMAGFIFIVLAVSLSVFWVKRLIGSFFEVKVVEEFWLSGMIISAVLTFVASYFAPLMIPVMKSQHYKRKETLRGIHRGEVKVEERWNVSVFSAMALLGLGVIFLSGADYYKSVPLAIGASFFFFYNFIDFLPMNTFDGTFMLYHNVQIYAILFILSFLLLVFSFFSYTGALISFLLFVAFGFVTFRLKLW